MLSIGRSNYMRFNHPAEAKHLRSVLPHSRISMAPISFAPSADGCQAHENHHLERKPPVAPPRRSPRNSCSDDEIGFLGKLTKFEMLSRQQSGRTGCVSPKVFPVGALTTNVPADQILGHARSSSLVSLTRSPVNGCNDEARRRGSPSGTNAANRGFGQQQNQRINPDRVGMYATCANACESPYCRESDTGRGCARSPSPRLVAAAPRGDPMSRSMTCESANELGRLVDRDCDMSQSLIVATKTTTTTEYLQLEKYGSNPSIGDADGDADVVGGTPRPSTAHGFGPGGASGGIRRTIQPPSPAFNRNPRYSGGEQKRMAVHARVKSPSPGRSLEELRERQADAESKRREAEGRRKRAQEERLREQEAERQERMRLDEILAMCAEYERQSTVEKQPRQPNR